MLRYISFLPECDAERRGALLTRRGGEADDAVQMLERAVPVARPHLVHRDGGLAVLPGDSERQRTPEDRLKEGRATAVREHGEPHELPGPTSS